MAIHTGGLQDADTDYKPTSVLAISPGRVGFQSSRLERRPRATRILLIWWGVVACEAGLNARCHWLRRKSSRDCRHTFPKRQAVRCLDRVAEARAPDPEFPEAASRALALHKQNASLTSWTRLITNARQLRADLQEIETAPEISSRPCTSQTMDGPANASRSTQYIILQRFHSVIKAPIQTP
jgi:hypothetical protein